MECYMFFRASALHTVHKLVTTTKYRYQHERATSTAEFSPTLQALLQVLDAIQPGTRWYAEERPNTITFTPLDVDCNPFRIQSMPSSLYLTHPENPSDPIRYLVRPPRLRFDLQDPKQADKLPVFEFTNLTPRDNYIVELVAVNTEFNMTSREEYMRILNITAPIFNQFFTYIY
jgi:hypothetical protein